MRSETNNSYLEAINRAIEFIESNLSTSISLEDIAAYSFLSKYHFHRVFKAIVGHTTKEYLTRLRLEKAALLLKNSDKTIQEVAYYCGYKSPETFSRAFTHFFSTTPSLFRKQSKQALQNKMTLHEETSIKPIQLSDPTIVEMKDLNLAYIRHVGSYEKVGRSFQKLIFWAGRNLVLSWKPTTLGIVHDDPSLTEESNIRFDACILVTKEIQAKGEVAHKKVNGGKFAVFRYTGPYDSFYPVYDYIYSICLFENKWTLRDEPALEWYIKSPPFTKPEYLVTDFYLPII